MSVVPEISYGETNPDQIKSDILAGIEANLGRPLYPGDPLRLFAMAFAAEDVQIRNMIDEAGRQNLLAYATGTSLDKLGELVGVGRLGAVGASVTLRYSTAQAAAAPITIPKGSQATPDGKVYFATDYEATIQAGQTLVDVQATCQTTGEAGNGWEIGEIDQIVQPIGFISAVANTTASSGGTATEDDDAYRLRIRLGVARFSNAGSRDAYEYWARTASAQIADVYVGSANPGTVQVYILLNGGVLPGQDLLAQVLAVLSADDVRPLTDLVTVLAPTAHAYTLDVTYYIRTDDAARAAEIQTAVAAAIQDYILWQKSAIGRDINPDELIARCVNAGAKRVAITAPAAFHQLANTEVASLSAPQTITYGGLEDD